MRRGHDFDSAEDALQEALLSAATQWPAEGQPRNPRGWLPAADDTLLLLFLSCHPALTAVSQVTLTLRAVGGLTTAQIARAFLVPDETMSRRISRSKQRIAGAGATFGPLTADERDERLGAVLRVLYMTFNEGYTATTGAASAAPVIRAATRSQVGNTYLPRPTAMEAQRRRYPSTWRLARTSWRPGGADASTRRWVASSAPSVVHRTQIRQWAANSQRS